jgi:hypothetical protein
MTAHGIDCPCLYCQDLRRAMADAGYSSTARSAPRVCSLCGTRHLSMRCPTTSEDEALLGLLADRDHWRRRALEAEAALAGRDDGRPGAFCEHDEGFKCAHCAPNG